MKHLLHVGAINRDLSFVRHKQVECQRSYQREYRRCCNRVSFLSLWFMRFWSKVSLQTSSRITVKNFDTYQVPIYLSL
jgi:hypothetical protein